MITTPTYNEQTYYQHIEYLLENVVNSMRSTGGITAIVDNGNGTYTFTVDSISNFYNGTYITITDTVGFNSTYQKIQNITSSSFDIIKTTGVSIPASLGNYKVNAPYYDFDNWLGEANFLSQKDNSKFWKNQKFPLIFLDLDTRNINVLDSANVYMECNFKLWFIDRTDVNYTAREHKTQFIENIYPIYNAFMIALKNSRYVKTKGDNAIQREIEEYPYQPNRLNATVEALMVEFSTLSIKNLSNNCN